MMASLTIFCNSFLENNAEDYDDDDDDELDFCSNSIVEIMVRRDFLLLQLQNLVDASTPQQAKAAIKAMNRESNNDEHLLKFLVRAGTVEILWNLLEGKPDEKEQEIPENEKLDDKDTTAPVLSQSTAEPLLKKLMPYYEQRQQRLLNKKRRRSWGVISS